MIEKMLTKSRRRRLDIEQVLNSEFLHELAVKKKILNLDAKDEEEGNSD